jgi:chloramphenicol 3-O-phosphotransferase
MEHDSSNTVLYLRSLLFVHAPTKQTKRERHHPGYNRNTSSHKHARQTTVSPHHLLRIGPSKCQSPSLEMKSWLQRSRALVAFSMNVSMVMPSLETIAGRAARHQRRARYSSVQGGWQRYIRRQLAFSYSTASSSVGSLSLGYMTLTSLLCG